MENLPAIIGAISGVASLLGILYMLGYWKGRVDNQLRSIQSDLAQHPLAEVSLMTKTLWNIYVIDALRGRPDLAEQHSSYKLKQEGRDLIPDELKRDLDKIPPGNPDSESIATGWEVVKHLGLDPIHAMARAENIPPQLAIAILSTYLAERIDTGH